MYIYSTFIKYTINIQEGDKMDLQQLRKYCLKKKGTSEAFPFDDETLLIKVGTKMFVLTNIKNIILKINLKCDPIMAEGLKREYSAIVPGYHMNKKHWITITFGGDVSDEKIKWLIDLSYDLVLQGLKKSEIQYINSICSL